MTVRAQGWRLMVLESVIFIAMAEVGAVTICPCVAVVVNVG